MSWMYVYLYNTWWLETRGSFLVPEPMLASRAPPL